MIQFNFNLPKPLQATKVLLRHHHGRMDRIRLLKLLYIADRELLLKTGRTLTGDNAVAMKYGPVLQEVYRLINGDSADVTAWRAEILADGHELVLGTEDRGTGKLTKGEVRKLDELSARYADFTDEDLVGVTHGFGEWAKVFDESKSATAMSWDAALEAEGHSGWAASIAADMIQLREVDTTFRESVC